MIDIKAIRAVAAAAPKDVWRYEPKGQTVWAGTTYMVADIRGWGHLKYLPTGAEIQDATGVHIATANPATVLALCDEIERLRKDADRLDWLEQNLFNRENIDWITKAPSTTHNMWVMFAPVGVQGSARGIIDAAMESEK